jgi:hypothetical protein
LSLRTRGNLIEVWLKNGKENEKKLLTGEKLANILGIDTKNLNFFFKDHESSFKVVVWRLKWEFFFKENPI